MKSESPIFIVGCPRSGTTLLGLMLDSHPDISVAHEAAIFHFLYNKGRQRWRLSSAEERKKFFERLEQHSNLREALGQDVVHTAAETLQSHQKLGAKIIVDALFNAYLQKTGKTIWGDKNPTHYYNIGDILDLYPHAAVICLIRDPRAVFASMKRYAQRKKGTDEWYWWMTENPEKASMLWLDCYESTVKRKDKIYFVKYEELVQSPESILRNLTQEYLSIPYSPKMLKYYRKSEDKIANMPDWHRPTTQKVNPANAERWVSELTSYEVNRIESILGKQMEEFGYELMSGAFGDMGSYRNVIKRNTCIGKYRINRSLRATAWRICHALKLIY